MSRRSGRSLVLCAQANGYGPAAKLLAVASRLDRNLGPFTFVGTGSALELAKTSPWFDELIETGPEAPLAREVIGAARGVVSVMDVGFAALALETKRPLYVADSLAWIRRPMPGEFTAADRYWMQNFPGLEAHLAATPVASGRLVGPILPRPASPGPAVEECVVGLGGYETPYVTADDDAGYAQFVVGGLLESGVTEAVRGGTLILAGRRCVTSLERRYAQPGVRFASLSHREAAAARSGAKMLLTAPGLTSTLECFQAARPTFLLPPQSYSQWRILDTLREAGIAPASFHWSDRTPPVSFAGAWSTEARVPKVRRAIRSVVADPAAGAEYRDRLAAMPGLANPELVTGQRAFLASLGADGTAEIVDELEARLSRE